MRTKDLSLFLYPACCTHCGQYVLHEDVLCLTCKGILKPLVSLILPLSKNQTFSVFAVSAYQDPLRRLILKKFYQDILSSWQLGKLMIEMSGIEMLNVDYIVPVPLHWTRYSWRGYNQAHEMARVLSKFTGKPLLPLIKRSKKTFFQSSLSLEQRKTNVENAFSLKWWYKNTASSMLAGKNILIIDDLCTTGATLKSIAKLLHGYKPASINALVACRAI